MAVATERPSVLDVAYRALCAARVAHFHPTRDFRIRMHPAAWQSALTERAHTTAEGNWMGALSLGRPTGPDRLFGVAVELDAGLDPDHLYVCIVVVRPA